MNVVFMNEDVDEILIRPIKLADTDVIAEMMMIYECFIKSKELSPWSNGYHIMQRSRRREKYLYGLYLFIHIILYYIIYYI